MNNFPKGRRQMKRILSIILSAIMIVSCMTVVSARETGEKNTYIVVLDAPAVHSPERVTFYGADDGVYREALIALQAEIKAQISGGASFFSLRNRERTYTYTDVLNGFTVNVDAKTAQQIKKIDGVKAVIKNETYSIIEPVADESSSIVETDVNTSSIHADISSGNMMNTQAAYDKGYNGKGTAIAVLDTAILPEHKYYSLADESGVRYSKSDIETVISEKGLNVSATAENAYYSAKIPFAYNYFEDSTDVSSAQNHGAHVTGIAAGGKVLINEKFYISGVAPEAQILFFGVFDKATGMAPADIVLSAMEDAVKFHADVINLSLGRPYRSENADELELFAEVAKNAENAGISVIYGAGNWDKGDNIKTQDIDYSTADNRSYLTTTKVGSVQNEYVDFVYLEDNLNNKYKCVSHGADTSFDLTEIIDCGSGRATDFGAADISGKIAFITMPHKADSPEGIGTYYSRAKNGGATGVVIAINTNNDLAYGTISNAVIPVVTVTKATGRKISDNGAKSLKFSNTKEILQSDDGCCVSDYSAYGYADSLDVSIDVAAPGGNILSATLYQNGYMYKSGTSMATPHISGATALMRQYVENEFPEYTGADKVRLIKKLLASTAKTVYDSNGVLASPRKVGSGLINLESAMSTSVYLTGINSDYSRVNLGADITKDFTASFMVHNLGNTSVTFDSANVELSTDDYCRIGNTTVFDGLKKLDATITGTTEVTVPANGEASVSINVTLSDEDIEYLNVAMTNGFFVDGKVTLSGEDNCDVGIPFSGFYGDWSKLPIMNEKRFLDFFAITGLSDDGFMPPAQILKENSQIVMPISDRVDSTIAQIPVAVFANPIRNAFMTVKCDGKTVVEDGFINKQEDLGYYLEDTILGDLSDVSAITIELRLPYDTDGKNKQSFTINVIKDNTPPVISDIYVSNKEDGDYAYIAVSDDYGVGVITMMGEYQDAWYYSDAYIESTEATAEFSIGELDDLHYFVYDCAFNMTGLLPHIGIDVKDNIATYTNNTHKTIEGLCMIAVYEGKKMTDFKLLSENAVKIDGYDAIEFDLTQYQGKNYKLFFWKDLTNIVPICDVYSK